MTDTEKLNAFGAKVDFGKTAADYATHRAGFPPAFFDLLTSRGFAAAGQEAVDLGCGTGTVARGLAALGLNVIGVEPAEALLVQARALDEEAGVSITYRVGQAEQTGLPDDGFDLVTAGQCWHWFDRTKAAQEANRLLRSDGRLLISHFDWLPLQGNVVAATEALILQHNPDWAGAGGTGIYPEWLNDLAAAGFKQIETASFDVAQPYSHEGWRGRIRASAGVAASLSEAETEQFDSTLAALLASEYPREPMQVPHRVWLTTGVAQ